MQEINLKDLLEAGCHFGHQVTKWHPKSDEYIYTTRDKIHIIDLAKTKKCLEEAVEFVEQLASQGKTIVFVGTKRQAKVIVEQEASQAGASYAVFRWPAGLITNWDEMKKNLQRLTDLETQIESEKAKPTLTKKEIVLLERDLIKLNTIYGGLRGLTERPNALFVIDIKKESTSVKEANRLDIPVVAITDTNSDPTLAQYPIPANDDAVGSITLITQIIANAYAQGRKKAKKQSDKEKTQAEKPKTEAKKPTTQTKKDKEVEKIQPEVKKEPKTPSQKKLADTIKKITKTNPKKENKNEKK